MELLQGYYIGPDKMIQVFLYCEVLFARSSVLVWFQESLASS